jgi:hypothetical protein
VRQRKFWFERFDGMYYALWWVAVGHIPSVDEAKDRLEYLRTHGESTHAFRSQSYFRRPTLRLPGL